MSVSSVFMNFLISIHFIILSFKKSKEMGAGQQKPVIGKYHSDPQMPKKKNPITANRTINSYP